MRPAETWRLIPSSETALTPMKSYSKCGESGLGKSTLINSLFLTDLYSPEYPGPSHRIKKTVQVEQSKVLIKEGGVQLLLTIVDTPGFGDAVDNSNCWQPVIDYIDSKFEDYLNAESRVNRRQMPDNRVQCCLYFVAPSGHGLKPLDIEFMKRLHEKVNIIPLIAKADTLTPEECQQFKKQIMKEIQEHKIKIYEFPETDDEEENKLVKKIKDRLPLAVVGSNTIIEVNGKRVRGRQYPWGVAEVENGEHCDFTILRNMLIRIIMASVASRVSPVLLDFCITIFTYKCLMIILNVHDRSPLAQMEEERREHVAKMKKMEMEMEQVFEMKVKEKVQKLKDSEAELQRRHEQMKKNLEAQHKELEEKRRQFEEEKANWEAQQRILEQQNSSRTLEKNKKKGKIF
ncbi:septin-7 [Marmota marmota marmota]|uniref:septin-7 n=1 Tax=Marmota marmota marmota TaxID=9994 RepID=UPI002093BCAF|nr:septin-7 [Marmota marmota marmota]